MKKVLSLLLSATVFFTACKKTDDRIFKETFDERINGSLAKYQSILTKAPNGWKVLITTNQGNGGTYSFYMKFNDSNRVTMVSDFDTSFAATPKTSGYRLRQQQQPTLIFDTYSYVHILADPNENAVIYSNVNGGPVGQGLLSDFEFIINPNEFASDTLKLTGKVNGARLSMVKANAEEAAVFLGGQWVLREADLSQKLLTYYKRISIGGKIYDMSNDPFARTITFQTLQGTTVIKHTSGYYNTFDGVGLNKPLPTSSGNISQISIGQWDAGTSTLNVKVGTENTTITETIFPIEGTLQIDAPQQWWDAAVGSGETYWITFDGFHVDGVDDAHNLRNLRSGGNTYYYFIYWPDYKPGSNDLFAPIFLNAAQTGLTLLYGAAPEKPNFSASTDGIIKFKSLGDYGTYPRQNSNPAKKAKNLFFQGAGFYFVKISDIQYDMVSAANGRAWLRWDLAL
jgi:hypothetical protein